MNKFKNIIIALIIILFSYHVVSYAQTSVTEKLAGVSNTGIISYVSTTNSGRKSAKEAVIFSDYDFGTTTAVFNGAGDSAVTSGWINVIDHNDEIIYQLDINTLESTGLSIAIEGLLSNDTSKTMDIFSKSFSTVVAGYDLPIKDKGLKYIRFKGIATGTDGTDSVSVNFRAEGRK